MPLTQMIEAGSANPLLLFLFALVLGGLHGLEPGHSKTMMAAYIVAVHGTVRQAVLLGLAAAFSHSIIVWVLAALALTWGDELIGEELEPYFMIASGLVVLGIAAWMLWRVWRPEVGPAHGHGHDVVDHDHNHAVVPGPDLSQSLDIYKTVWRLSSAKANPQRIYQIKRPPRA